MSRERKTLATVLGQVKVIDGRKRFVPNSPPYFQGQIDRLPTGKPITVSFEEHHATRSQQQLAYHWVLMGFIAEHTGYTKEDAHDAVMRLKFGTKRVTIAGKTVEVRQSIANRAKMSKSDVVELITYDLKLCEEMGIYVPTQEELGYISN